MSESWCDVLTGEAKVELEKVLEKARERPIAMTDQSSEGLFAKVERVSLEEAKRLMAKRPQIDVITADDVLEILEELADGDDKGLSVAR